MGGPQLIGPAPDIAALYGHKVVWAEAFTAESDESAWRNDPWRMKPYGDAAYCQGINHFIMHGFTHNPLDDRYQPGLTMGFWGTQMNRHRHLVALLRPAGTATWLAASSCSGKGCRSPTCWPIRRGPSTSPAPVLDTGAYQQTVLNDETLLERLAVRDGRIVLPHGASYAALGAGARASRCGRRRSGRLRDLVGDGATLIGPRPPSRSASLENYPACDQEAARLIDELWGKPAAAANGSRKVGRGQVIADRSLIEVLDELTGGPDFVCRRLRFPFSAASPKSRSSACCSFIAAPTAADAYFVCNQDDRVNEIAADFRVARKQPELWDPVSGDIRPLSDFRIQRRTDGGSAAAGAAPELLRGLSASRRRHDGPGSRSRTSPPRGRCCNCPGRGR